MATATMSADGSDLQTSRLQDVSPHPTENAAELEEAMKKSNGYVSSPLRSSHTINSLAEQDLPSVPKEEPASDKPNNARFDAVGALLTSRPGASTDLATGQGQIEEATSDPLAKSVQFTPGAGGGDEPAPLTRSITWEAEEDRGEPAAKERQGSLFEKLKALASSSSSSNTRGMSNVAGSTETSGALSPQSEHGEPTYPVEPSEEVEAHADIEEDSDDVVEDLGTAPKKRRKIAGPQTQTAETAPPATPKLARLESRLASFMRDPSRANESRDSPSRPNEGLARLNTSSNASDHGQAGVSEDEGRDRIRGAWRRGIEGARGMSYHARHKTDTESPDARRPGHLRRITGLALDGASSGSPFRTREKPERQTTTSAQKWRQVKAGLKMIGQRRREERMRVDHQKSAQLMAELLAGAPAALVLASMFQRDEHNHQKIPVLLEQIKIRIPDSQMRKEKEGDRHLIFKIDLEYGNGPARMRWTIWRSLRDFINLHAKYQAEATADKIKHPRSEHKSKAKMPRFPKSAFPYGRGVRGLWDNLQEDDNEDDEADVPQTPGGGLLAGYDSPVTPGPFTPGPVTPLVPGGSTMAGTPFYGPTSTGALTRPTPFSNESSLRPGLVSTESSAKPRRRLSAAFLPRGPRRTSTTEIGPLPNNPEEMTDKQTELYVRRQRRKLETYLQQMIRWLIFRADSTRLCKFLEVSALAIRLSAEGGYQGKQGLMTIVSRGNKELRKKPFKPVAAADRHRSRWFLIRHSYIVCVDGPESLNPYDVFLVDPDFSTEKKKRRITAQTTAGDVAKAVAQTAVDAPKRNDKHHFIRLYNSERKLKLLAKSDRQHLQFMESLKLMAEATIWSKKQRFASFAPVRHNVWCRWLVDGRDHTWQVSRAIDNAKDFVYIHGWWVSPELYMRRPAAISQKWRLDRLLQRKAEEGVKIFVIVYRNIESAIPIDSEYTKWSFLDLHPNICIQRSPNQFRQNQFFWAHHEKLVVVDNMMAFVGGIDLCFGRWDDPCHTLTDDKLTGFELDHVGPRDSEHCQMWPGKDYSNPRVQDFYALDRPYEEMYDRTKVPRMPWHDISMQLVGQPARDVGRHFVQRWNYILRSRIPSRPTPVLLPPPEYEQMELEDLGMTGTCQVQVLRSCGSWSMGTPNKIEHSIMNAYVRLIESSEHFVYIENQFFVTSCTVEGTPIHNKIGDALVERIIRAHENDEKWQACIVIPLMPGFQNSVDSQDGTSLRLILQCQFRSICRGETSIFGRVRARGIDPEDYIRFYSLRQWGKIGPRKCLTTEQLYIHAKCMVVDDRSVIIGSANINERSMLGNRDSEVAAIVTDTNMISSYMGGEPYDVGEFAHTLRKRLQREHLGIDVDAVYKHDQAVKEREEQDAEMARIYRHEAGEQEDYFSIPGARASRSPPLPQRHLGTGSVANVSNGLDGTTRVGSAVSLDESIEKQHEKRDRKGTLEFQHDLDVEGLGFDNMKALGQEGHSTLRDSYINSRGREVLIKKEAPDISRVKSVAESEVRRSESLERKEKEPIVRPPYPTERMDTYSLGLEPRYHLPELPALDDTDIGGPPLKQAPSLSKKGLPPLAHILKRPKVLQDSMTDPIVPTFYNDIWHQVAENNTRIYRQVFRCMPDSEVLDWKTYERYNDYNERFMQSQGLGSSKPKTPKDAPGKSGPPGSGGTELDSISSTAADGRPRSKSVLSNWVDKLRPGSKASDEPTHTEDLNEKEEHKRSPGSPESNTSSGPTAVPSPQPEPLDEKEAQKAADEAQVEQKDHAQEPVDEEKEALKEGDASDRRRTVQYSDKINQAPETTAVQSTPPAPQTGNEKRRRRGTTKSSAQTSVPEEVLGSEAAEGLLKMVQGHVVLWPYNWLEKEERNGNWLYNIDQLAPLEIYD